MGYRVLGCWVCEDPSIYGFIRATVPSKALSQFVEGHNQINLDHSWLHQQELVQKCRTAEWSFRRSQCATPSFGLLQHLHSSCIAIIQKNGA